MTKIQLGAVAAVIVAAVGMVWYVTKSQPAPKVEEAQGIIGLKQQKAAAGTICVRPVAVYAEKKVELAGSEAALVSQLRSVGLDAKLESEAGGDCAATVYTDISELGGRGEKTAAVAFRLLLKGEEVPVLSAEVKGKSGAAAKAMPKNSFLPVKGVSPDDAAKYQEALNQAFLAQAEKVRDAYGKHAK